MSDILKVENVTLQFGGVKAITDISFNVKEGEICAVIGPNGAGKSSMLNVINGVYLPQIGTVTYDGVERRSINPRDAAIAGMARTFQNIALFQGMTGKIIAGFAVGLALQGLAQIMAPDPSVDDPNNPENYLFNGAQLNMEEGDPMPLLYGELRVPGRQASLHVTGGSYQNSNAMIDSLGNVYQTDSRNEPEPIISKDSETGTV